MNENKTEDLQKDSSNENDQNIKSEEIIESDQINKEGSDTSEPINDYDVVDQSTKKIPSFSHIRKSLIPPRDVEIVTKPKFVTRGEINTPPPINPTQSTNIKPQKNGVPELRKLKISRPCFNPLDGMDPEKFSSKTEAYLIGYLNCLYHRLDGAKRIK